MISQSSQLKAFASSNLRFFLSHESYTMFFFKQNTFTFKWNTFPNATFLLSLWLHLFSLTPTTFFLSNQTLLLAFWTERFNFLLNGIFVLSLELSCRSVKGWCYFTKNIASTRVRIRYSSFAPFRSIRLRSEVSPRGYIVNHLSYDHLTELQSPHHLSIC